MSKPSEPARAAPYDDPKIIAFPRSRAAPSAVKRRALSQYERYDLPFFDVKCLSTWSVEPTGKYTEDCKTGSAYAVAFLESNDGTVGWTTLLPQIVGDMIGAGPSGFWNDGKAKTNGIVVGFMRTIGKALCAVDTHALSAVLVAMQSRDGDGV